MTKGTDNILNWLNCIILFDYYDVQSEFHFLPIEMNFKNLFSIGYSYNYIYYDDCLFFYCNGIETYCYSWDTADKHCLNHLESRPIIEMNSQTTNKVIVITAIDVKFDYKSTS